MNLDARGAEAIRDPAEVGEPEAGDLERVEAGEAVREQDGVAGLAETRRRDPDERSR